METKDKEVTKNDNIYLVKENRKLQDLIESHEIQIEVLLDLIFEYLNNSTGDL